MAGHYHPGLVTASVVIAMVSAYAALDLAARVTAAQGRARAAWLWGGAAALGTGIWSMHYTAMLAFHLPVVVRYDLATVAASLLAAILASAVALWVVSCTVMGLRLAAAASVVMGLAIATMHYLGMQALRLPGTVVYNPAIVALSIAVAFVVAFVAVWRAFSMREESRAGWSWPKTLTAMYMGAAIPAMHYTGMAAATFFYDSPAPVDVHHGAEAGITGVVVVVLATTILAIAIVASLVNRRFSKQTAALQDSERLRALSQAELTRLASFPEFDPNSCSRGRHLRQSHLSQPRGDRAFPRDRGSGAAAPRACQGLGFGYSPPARLGKPDHRGDRDRRPGLSAGHAGDRIENFWTDVELRSPVMIVAQPETAEQGSAA